MSVEKYKPSFVEGEMKHEPKPYTQILNKVLQECTNCTALAVWCYLQSKPENWLISPQHIQNHFKMGKDKAYEVLNYLICANLLTRERAQRANGTYLRTNYILRNGENFKDIQDVTFAHPLPVSPDPVQPEAVKPDTTNKRENTNTNKKHKQSLCASDDARATFDSFWKIYPKRKDKQRAFKIWVVNNLSSKLQHILDKLILQVRHEAQWKNKKYIPLPTTYLRGERWEDEIEHAKESSFAQVARELKEGMRQKDSTKFLN